MRFGIPPPSLPKMDAGIGNSSRAVCWCQVWRQADQTFVSILDDVRYGRGGDSPIQKLMRHSTLELTGRYTRPRAIVIEGAASALPSLRSDGFDASADSLA